METYLIPDADTLNVYFDVFLLANFVNVIILRSVFHKLKYTFRMRRTMNEFKRHYILFENENFVDTFVKDKQERVAAAARWFESHLQKRKPKLIVLSKDEPTIQNLKTTGLFVCVCVFVFVFVFAFAFVFVFVFVFVCLFVCLCVVCLFLPTSSQRAQVSREHFRQHVESPVGEVHRGGPGPRLQVELAVQGHEMGHICDVHS